MYNSRAKSANLALLYLVITFIKIIMHFTIVGLEFSYGSGYYANLIIGIVYLFVAGK